MKPERSPVVDHLRAGAIVGMVCYHTVYDCVNQGLLSLNLEGGVWKRVPDLIIASFLFAVGASLQLSHRPGIRWGGFARRLAKIVAAAAVVTVGTRLFFPEEWVYFGTLHEIAFASLLCLPFLGRPKWALVGGVLLFLPEVLGVRVPWILLSHAAMDYIPPVPWSGFALLGVGAVGFGLERISVGRHQWSEWLSRHSLTIYLVHQVPIWGVVRLIAKLIVSRE